MNTMDLTGESALAIRSERIFEVQRFAILPNLARRLPRRLVCPSRSISISNVHPPQIRGNPTAPESPILVCRN